MLYLLNGDNDQICGEIQNEALSSGYIVNCCYVDVEAVTTELSTLNVSAEP